jgi:cytochrome c-type biogenesis protein CcmH/NrfG
MDIRNAYGRRADFEAHCASLTRATQNDPENGDLWFLLGYCHYYSDDMPKAADALARAARLRPEDELLARFAQLSGLSARSKRQVPPEKATPPPRKEL